MAVSCFFFVISVLLVGQAWCQNNYDPDYDDPIFVRPTPSPIAQDCANKEMDIYFILDSSTSIYVLDYRRQIEFTKEIVNRLDISPRATRVGVLTYSDAVNERPIELNRYSNKPDLLGAINEQNLPYRTGITNTDQAIRYVRENRNFRTDITKVIVVVTDGGSRSPGMTAREADLAREQGFYLFVIGVGMYLDENEWQAIASDPDSNFIYNLTNFLYLDNVKFTLPTKACKLPPLLVGACRVSANDYASLYYVSTTRQQESAVELSRSFIQRTTGQSRNILLNYVFEYCADDARDLEFRVQDPNCPLIPLYGEAPVAFAELLSRTDSLASEARQARADHNQVVIVVVDDTQRTNLEEIRRQIRALQEDELEVIIVDVSSRGLAVLQNSLSRRENYIRFLSSSFSGQEPVHQTLTQRVCDAITRLPELVTPDVN